MGTIWGRASYMAGREGGSQGGYGPDSRTKVVVDRGISDLPMISLVVPLAWETATLTASGRGTAAPAYPSSSRAPCEASGRDPPAHDYYGNRKKRWILDISESIFMHIRSVSILKGKNWKEIEKRIEYPKYPSPFPRVSKPSKS